MTVLHFHRHKYARCTNRWCPGCHLCHGGIAVCVRCRGTEGSLPSDCPGDMMTREQEAAVYAGELDWQKGYGWVNEPSRNSPGYYTRK